jgi:hypothetical protein
VNSLSLPPVQKPPVIERPLFLRWTLSPKSILQQSLALFLNVPGNSGHAPDILAKQAKFAEARKAYTESLAMRNEIAEKATAAESRLALADLTIAEGNTPHRRLG